MKPLAGGGSRLYSHESVAHRDTEARMTFAGTPDVTKAKTRTRRPAKTTRRRKTAYDSAPPNPPEANIPPLDVAIPEGPDQLRKREEAFQRRRRLTR